MPMLRTGVDLIEIDRVAAAIERFGPRFLERVFTPAERAVCGGKVDSFAVRFAAKEAVAKALGAGIWRTGIDWTDIEVLRNLETGEPVLLLHGEAQAQSHRLGITEWSISLSHARRDAVAFVIAVSG